MTNFSETSRHIIKVENLSKSINGIKVLDSISFNIEEHTVTSIIGSSGSGKTTLLKCLSALELPDNGKIHLCSANLTTLPRKDLPRGVGIVFQNFNLFPHMNVIDNLVSALIYSGIYDKKESVGAEKKAEAFLSEVGLYDKRFEFPRNLSGGQKQRVAIARALMASPEILLLDEPTSALDIEVIKDVIDIILKLKASGITIITVTHHINFAKKISDNIIFMDKGRVLEHTPASQFFSDPTSERAKIFLSNIKDIEY